MKSNSSSVAVRVRCLAQGTQLGGAGNRSSNLLVTSQDFSYLPNVYIGLQGICFKVTDILKKI